MQLNLNNLNGNICTISAGQHWAARDVKNEVALTLQIPTEAQRLALGSYELLDTDEVAKWVLVA